jgi:hypothetical protein
MQHIKNRGKYLHKINSRKGWYFIKLLSFSESLTEVIVSGLEFTLLNF